MAKSIKEDIVKALASGQFVSGQSLADDFGISRAAISNQISALIEMGLDIFKVRGKGYQLAQPINLLDRTRVQECLAGYGTEVPVEVHNIIDSTNDYLMRKLPNQVVSGQVCLAEYQQAGRGRRGRQWISPFGSHLYLSIYYKLEQGMSQAMGLSLVTALAVKDAITQTADVKVQLKWPNDVYADGRKLAGILIDLEGQATGECHCVIGIGLNVQMPESMASHIDQPWSDIASFTNGSIDRNLLAARLIHCLDQRIAKQKNEGLASMLDDWHQHDLYLNQKIRLLTGDNATHGVCRGVNEQGALLLEVDDVIKPIYGGEVSVRSVS